MLTGPVLDRKQHALHAVCVARARARALSDSPNLSARARSLSLRYALLTLGALFFCARPRAWEARGLPVTREALLLARCFLFGALGAGAAWRGNAGFALYPAPSLAVPHSRVTRGSRS